jgi:GrpB-like predicted nucleotidyltransferase (UPF0157 family)
MVPGRPDLTHYRLVPYDPKWPAIFEEEKTRILGAAGKVVLSVEHIGSTAVPGLSAKPVIDMIGGVRSLSDVFLCVKPLAGIGYDYRRWQQFGAIDPGRRYFRKGSPGHNTHHLSLVEHLSPIWNDYLLFRDHLHTNPETAREYSELKKELLEKYGLKGEPVEKAKTAFVKSVLARARH